MIFVVEETALCCKKATNQCHKNSQKVRVQVWRARDSVQYLRVLTGLPLLRSRRAVPGAPVTDSSFAEEFLQQRRHARALLFTHTNTPGPPLILPFGRTLMSLVETHECDAGVMWHFSQLSCCDTKQAVNNPRALSAEWMRIHRRHVQNVHHLPVVSTLFYVLPDESVPCFFFCRVIFHLSVCYI